ncbi:MAG TPA: hypothetical protein VHT92_06685 [Candidatus Cybelea sp.]|nr:hypothetical protein [Candidatus Cybelea sp.]
MALFPPAAAVAVVVDGSPLAAYQRAYLADGRVFAPVAPLLMRIADRFWLDGDTLVAERNGRRAYVRLSPRAAGELSVAYVAAAAVLRALGAAVRYEASGRRLVVTLPARGMLASPTPFDPAAPSAAPRAVFTPLAPATPRPLWTGSPMPRRTGLPFPPP